VKARLLRGAEGSILAGFEPVQQVFSWMQDAQWSTGSACVAYHRGERVVQLSGGEHGVNRLQPTPSLDEGRCVCVCVCVWVCVWVYGCVSVSVSGCEWV
jgi:hypothetical protein